MWQKTDRSQKYGVALYNYHSRLPHRLTLNIGDTVQIFEELDGWFYGCKTKNKTECGIFPKSYIHVREAVVAKFGSLERVTSTESPIAQEISTVLREWYTIWKQFYLDRSEELEKIRGMMLELMDWRKKIMSRKLTNEEVKDLQQKVSSRIDFGNAMLGLDLVVRDEQGNILNPDDTSVVELYKQHETASDRIRLEQNTVTGERDSSITGPQTFNLFVQLRNFVCRIGEDADILMSLYDAKFSKFISENYIVHWGKEGVPKDLEMLNNFRVVFTDLGSRDRTRERVYLVFQIIRIGVMDPKDVDDKKQTRALRRPFGVAAIDITEYLNGQKNNEAEEDKQIFIPFQSCGEKEFMDSLIKKVVVAKEINHKGQGLWVSLKVLQGDVKQVKEDYPHLVGPNTDVSRKLGFPDVIMPGDVRNDIYVTIKGGEFTRGPAKTADKNVEVTMVVCNNKGEVLENVISYGCGGEMMSAYKSLIYYHEDKPKWQETVKVAISTEEEFKGLHLKFTFKHRSTSDAKDRSERPFAMSFIKLMNKNSTTLSDTDHNLLVYKDHNSPDLKSSKKTKITEKKEDRDKFSPYLDLPSTREKFMEEQSTQPNNKLTFFSGPFTLSAKDSFVISSFVCSTKLTHNVVLLGLLQWQDIMTDTTKLRDHLEKLMKVDGEEIVKFLQDLLDSLFSILMQNTISDVYDNLVFDALVHIISLISDRKYHQFRPVLDAYVESSFSFAMAYQKLMIILRDYVDKAMETNQKILKSAMKSLEYLFKFIVQSRNHFARLNDGRGKQSFELQLKQLIKSISNMMLYTSDNTLVAQGSALKYMCATIPDILKVFDAVELSHLMVEFINNVPKERLTKQKLKCIDDLVHSKLFAMPECRLILLPMMLQHTRTLMEQQEEMEDCIEVLSNILNLTFSKEMVSHDDDVSIIAKMSLRTVIQACIRLDKTSKEAKEAKEAIKCVCVLLGMLRQMKEIHYTQYMEMEEFAFPIDLRDFLMEILMLFLDLVCNNVFPGDWMEMIMLENSIILRALQIFAKVIHDKFTQEFEKELWGFFFKCSISFLTQKSLQLEHFTSSKRTKIVCRYRDMRREAGFEIRQMWFHLGPNKVLFIPDLVGSILEMTLIPEIELRKATIPIFFDMMVCEFMQIEQSTRKIRGNFNQVEHELIMCLDALVEGGLGDEEYKDLMCEILYKLCSNHTTLKEQGLRFVNTIKELLQHLLEYRKIIQSEVKELRMSCIVNLLNFYHDIGRQEMYIRYLYKLCDLHMKCDNYTEAANTLKLHVGLLNWTDQLLDPMLKSSWYPKAHTHRELKEILYYDIVSFYDKGKMWEKGIELTKELVDLYEEELFDYERLSVILKRQAELFACIIRELRPDPEYFRVGYYGRGFPSFLQNKVFIYRGKEYERLTDFNSRMQTLFPNAELLKSLSPPSNEVKESDKQYLQINAVTPVLELQERFRNKSVNEKILKYYSVNEVQKFTFSRRIDESGADLSQMWLERTYLTTLYSFPGILCWFPVNHTDTKKVSPLENAIETLESTNKRINSLIEQHIADSHLSTNNLGMLLNGVVDASVNGGISNYKVFYTEGYGESEIQLHLVHKLKDVTKNQVMLLREALNIHNRKVSEELRPFHEHMEQRFKEMVKLIHKEYNLNMPEAHTATLKRYKSMSAVSLSRVSEAFISTNSTQMSTTDPSGTPVKLPHAVRTPSVFIKPDKSAPTTPMRPPTISRMNPFKRTSVASTTANISDHSSSEGGGSNRNSLEAPIELSEQLTTRRPPRPDQDQRRLSRPNSFQLMHPIMNSTSSTSLVSNTSSTNENSDQELGDDTPPLPEKTAYSDYTNVEITPSPSSHHRANTGNRKSKPVPPLPTEMNGTPPPVPKKNTAKQASLT
uniref:Dedicator of cytokinesis protein 1-like isoform X2 n=1 Tax=Crassostrea virginica TaxID=6565 RepID=A0A8B8EVP6_CRAVI|nr:dedicator of cytokinesis protein 1-like isoform X2 [Crassostrea virginica]